MALKLGSNDTAILAGSSVVKQILLGSSPKFAAPVLDHVPGAAAAYSLRRLSNAYSGPVVKVRRSSDSTTADFTAAEVVDGTLEAWVGAGDGFVDTWYDQSGNERNATQATTTDQPKIVESGSLILSGSVPAVRFATVNDTSTFRLQTAAFSPAIPQPFSVFLVFNRTLNDDRQAVFASRTNNVSLGLEANTGAYLIAAGASIAYGTKQTGLQSHYGLFLASASSAYIDGAFSVSSDAGSNSLDGVTLGNLGGVPSVVASGYGLIGTISEVIVYPSDVSASRELAEGEMAWHYGLQAKLPYDHAYAPQALGGASQTVPTDSDVLAFAAASGATSIPDLNKIEDLVAYLKAESLWDYARFYPMKSAQNAGTGSTVYGLGGLTSNNMTLVNSPTWGSDGVTFDGSTQYGVVSNSGVVGAAEFSYIRRSTPTAASLADTNRLLAASFGDLQVDGFNLWLTTSATTGETAGAAFSNSLATAARAGSSVLAWSAGEDFTLVYQTGAGQSMFKDKSQQTLDRLNGITALDDCGPVDVGLSDGVYIEAGTKSGGTLSGNASPGVVSASLIYAATSQLTTTQRETITDLINAL